MFQRLASGHGGPGAFQINHEYDRETVRLRRLIIVACGAAIRRKPVRSNRGVYQKSIFPFLIVPTNKYTMKKLRKFLQEQFAYVESLDKQCDSDESINLEAAEIVEESRRRCAEFGFDDIGDEAYALSPREALPILGKLLTWVREKKSQTDWLSPPQVAKMMGVKPDKILYWIHAGLLPAVNVAKKEGGRPQFAVTPAGLDIFSMRRTTQTPVKVKRARPKSSGKVYV